MWFGICMLHGAKQKGRPGIQLIQVGKYRYIPMTALTQQNPVNFLPFKSVHTMQLFSKVTTPAQLFMWI